MSEPNIIRAYRELTAETAKAALYSVPLAELTNGQACKLLFLLGKSCYLRNLSALMEQTFQRFAECRESIDPHPGIFYLLAYPVKMNANHLSFLLAAQPELSDIDYLTEIIHCESVVDASRAMSRLTVLYPSISRDTWSLVCDVIEKMSDEDTEYHNPQLLAFAKRKLTESASTAPSWVRSYEPLHLSECPPLPKGDEAVDIIMNYCQQAVEFVSSDEAADEDLVRSSIMYSYSLAPVAQKMSMLNFRDNQLFINEDKTEVLVPEQTPVQASETAPELFDDTAIFREHGPVNTTRDGTDCDSRYGGCRMFTCTCGEPIPEDNARAVVLPRLRDWFVGHCVNKACGESILHYWWALRLPLPQGSWQGCFCSFTCLRARARRFADPLLDVNINTLSDQLQEIGIRERSE